MQKRSPFEVFGEWAEIGKDEGMAKGHESAVGQLLESVLPVERPFSFLDAGCGNGWVVRKVGQLPNCSRSEGVDGSVQMIEKARSIDPSGRYHLADLTTWKPETSFDIVHSMEVFYYIADPLALLQSISASWLNAGGKLVMGIDYYAENTTSHDWPEKTQINQMKLLSISEWVALFQLAGFSDVQSRQIDAKPGWAGTLCVVGAV